jgi:hypothetical protein
VWWLAAGELDALNTWIMLMDGGTTLDNIATYVERMSGDRMQQCAASRYWTWSLSYQLLGIGHKFEGSELKRAILFRSDYS